MPEWPIPTKKEMAARKATAIMHNAVYRAIKDPEKVYEDPERAREEGLDTAKKMLSKVSRGTRKELEQNVVNNYKKRD